MRLIIIQSYAYLLLFRALKAFFQDSEWLAPSSWSPLRLRLECHVLLWTKATLCLNSLKIPVYFPIRNITSREKHKKIVLSIRNCGLPIEESNSIARSGEEFDISSANSSSVAILILSFATYPHCNAVIICAVILEPSFFSFKLSWNLVACRKWPKYLADHVIRTYDGTTTKLKMAVVVVNADRNVRKWYLHKISRWTR